MPKLAQEVIDLKDSVSKEKAKVEELAKQLENPDNHPNKIELGGEDPDLDALEAKI